MRSKTASPLSSLTMASPSIRQETRRQRRDRRHDQGKALAEIVAVADQERHAPDVPPHQNAEAVVLDLVQPIGTDRRRLRRRGQSWFDEAGRCRAFISESGSEGAPLAARQCGRVLSKAARNR
jgi:hypothetical protein